METCGRGLPHAPSRAGGALSCGPGAAAASVVCAGEGYKEQRSCAGAEQGGEAWPEVGNPLAMCVLG